MKQGREVTIMPKELRDAPVTELTLPCPCCEEQLIISVRATTKEVSVSCVSVKMRATQESILRVADKALL